MPILNRVDCSRIWGEISARWPEKYQFGLPAHFAVRLKLIPNSRERWRGKFSQVTSVSLSGKVEQCAREEINPLILDFPAGHPVFPAEKQARLG